MLYAYLVTAIAAAILSGAGVWKVQDWRYGAIEADRLASESKIKAKQVDRIDVASVGREKDKAQLRTDFAPITETITHVIREPFYLPSELCLDADGLRALSAATGAKPAASQSAGTLPRPGPAK